MLAPVLSGALLVLAFPNYDFTGFAWVGLTPLLIAMAKRGLGVAFLLSFACGLLFFVGIFSWMFEVPGYKLHHHALIVCYLALFFGLFGLSFKLIKKRLGSTHAFLAAPFIWVSLEYLRSNAFFLALPWGLLAHSQHENNGIIQFVSFTGTYGLSFLVVLANVSFAALLMAFFFRSNDRKYHACPHPSRWVAIAMVVSTAVLTGLALIYGQIALSRPTTGNSIKVSVIQGNIDREKKKQPLIYAKSIVQKYDELTTRASKDQASLIVWPESATSTTPFSGPEIAKGTSTPGTFRPSERV